MTVAIAAKSESAPYFFENITVDSPTGIALAKTIIAAVRLSTPNTIAPAKAIIGAATNLSVKSLDNKPIGTFADSLIEPICIPQIRIANGNVAEPIASKGDEIHRGIFIE